MYLQEHVMIQFIGYKFSFRVEEFTCKLICPIRCPSIGFRRLKHIEFKLEEFMEIGWDDKIEQFLLFREEIYLTKILSGNHGFSGNQ